MENYTNGITEEMLILNNITNLQIIQEKGWKPRMVLNQNGEEIIIDGEEKIILFIEQLTK